MSATRPHITERLGSTTESDVVALPHDTPTELRELYTRCCKVLDDELAFYSRLETLLTGMVTANLFSTEAATSLSRQIDGLQQQRETMDFIRDACLHSFKKWIPVNGRETRMSDLEPLLGQRDRDQFRHRRLHLIRRMESVQHLLRRTDVMLAVKYSLFSDLIAALTGQSPSANCYGANGRHTQSTPGSIVETVS